MSLMLKDYQANLEIIEGGPSMKCAGEALDRFQQKRACTSQDRD
jgi:hypothetical protein